MVKHNDAGGGMSVKDVVITFAKNAVLIGVLYFIGYFVFVAPGKHGISPTLGRFLVKTLNLYPNVGPEDLNIWLVHSMFQTMLLLAVVISCITVYLKYRGKASAETKRMFKTFLIWFATVSVVYWLYYYIATFLASTHITKALWNPVREVIYPPVYPEDFDREDIRDMYDIMLLLAVFIASTATYLKYRRKKQ